MVGVPETLYLVAVSVWVEPVSIVADEGESVMVGVVGMYVKVVLGIKFLCVKVQLSKALLLYPLPLAPVTVLP